MLGERSVCARGGSVSGGQYTRHVWILHYVSQVFVCFFGAGLYADQRPAYAADCEFDWRLRHDESDFSVYGGCWVRDGFLGGLVCGSFGEAGVAEEEKHASEAGCRGGYVVKDVPSV
jgi:hypothetical protein